MVTERPFLNLASKKVSKMVTGLPNWNSLLRNGDSCTVETVETLYDSIKQNFSASVAHCAGALA